MSDTVDETWRILAVAAGVTAAMCVLIPAAVRGLLRIRTGRGDNPAEQE